MRLSVWMLSVFIAGCASTLKPCPELLRKHAPFVHPGQSTKGELLDRFGPVAKQHEGGRILIYVMRQDNQGLLRVVDAQSPSESPPEESWRPEVYNLVLVFREDGVLERHSMLRVR